MQRWRLSAKRKNSLNIRKRQQTQVSPKKIYPSFPQDRKSALLKILECFSSCCILFAKMPQNFISLAKTGDKLLLLTKSFLSFSTKSSSGNEEINFQNWPKTLPQKNFSLSVRKRQKNSFLYLKISQQLPPRTRWKPFWQHCWRFFVNRPETFRSVSEEGDKSFHYEKEFCLFSQYCPSGHLKCKFYIPAEFILSGGREKLA